MMFLAALVILPWADFVSGFAHCHSTTRGYNNPFTLRTTALPISTVTNIENSGSINGRTLEYSDDIISAGAADAAQFLEDLDNVDLSQCYGILHATGCRKFSDIGRLTLDQLSSMGVDDDLTISIFRNMIDNQQQQNESSKSNSTLSTQIDGSLLTTTDTKQNFDFQVICAENGIFKGTLFTPDQCNQLARMAEYHAYKINPTWHGMSCKSIPRFIPTTQHIFEELLSSSHGLYSVYPEMMVGTLKFESDSEPHLVKYSGKRKEAPLHKDNTHKSITINVLLSDKQDFGGGGTYIQAIDKVIKLKQGEFLVHPGNLDHAGAEITFGVRRLLVAFLECEWD